MGLTSRRSLNNRVWRVVAAIGFMHQISGKCRNFVGKQLVVLAGDTHNAWASELRDMHGDQVGVEYATHSVSSPGMETYMGFCI